MLPLLPLPLKAIPSTSALFPSLLSPRRMVLCAVHSKVIQSMSQPRLLLLMLRQGLNRLLVQLGASKTLSQLLRRQLPRRSSTASASHTRTTPLLSHRPPPIPSQTQRHTPRASTWSASWLGPPLPTATWAQHPLSPPSLSLMVSPRPAAPVSTSMALTGCRWCPLIRLPPMILRSPSAAMHLTSWSAASATRGGMTATVHTKSLAASAWLALAAATTSQHRVSAHITRTRRKPTSLRSSGHRLGATTGLAAQHALKGLSLRAARATPSGRHAMVPRFR